MSSFQQYMFDEAFQFKDTFNSNNATPQTQESEDEEELRLGEQRVPPLGACSNELTDHDAHAGLDMNKYLEIQEESELLNSSLYALTSHFAQVQFRLKQILNAPKSEQDKLLAELEGFAFEGCPDVSGPKHTTCTSCATHSAVEQYEQRVAEEKAREVRLNAHLAAMISSLETCQKNESANDKKNARKKISTIKEDEVDSPNVTADPTTADLSKHMDKTLSKLIDPHQGKDSIIQQVSKQINEMEKFVSFLQTYEEPERTEQLATKQKNTSVTTNQSNVSTSKFDKLPAPHTKILQMNEEKRKRFHQASLTVIKKSLAILQIFAISQFGCSAKRFRDYMVKKSFNEDESTSGYVKPIQELRGAIDQIIALHTKLIDVGGLHPDSEDELNLPLSTTDKRASWARTRPTSTSARSRNDSMSSTISSAPNNNKPVDVEIQDQLVRIVRGQFTQAIKDLMQHGLCQTFGSKALSTEALVGCMSSRSIDGQHMHVWEYFNKFYTMKHGAKYNNQPSMMLSEAFGMDIGCTQQTPKQSLLTVLHRIKTTHEPRKRSFDAMFKALVSAALNRGRLAQWVRLVIRCPETVDHHYERWSYVVRTGFDDVLTLLEKLSSLTFFLPEDLAIRHLLKNTNEFGDA